jgi:hypothetical protein
MPVRLKEKTLELCRAFTAKIKEFGWRGAMRKGAPQSRRHNQELGIILIRRG